MAQGILDKLFGSSYYPETDQPDDDDQSALGMFPAMAGPAPLDTEELIEEMQQKVLQLLRWSSYVCPGYATARNNKGHPNMLGEGGIHSCCHSRSPVYSANRLCRTHCIADRNRIVLGTAR